MKLVAVVQFFISYVLPRASDWEGKGVTIHFPNLLAKVSPRGINDPLFPSEIDQTLSTMELQLNRISLPVSTGSHFVRDSCRDRVKVIVEGETNPDTNPSEDIERHFRETAIEAANVFLSHCRVAAEAPFMTGIEEHYRLDDSRRYLITPHTITWYDGTTGERFPFYEVAGEKVNASAASGAIQSPERGSVSMVDIYQSLQASPEPDLPRSLLLDARERVITMRLRGGRERNVQNSR